MLILISIVAGIVPMVLYAVALYWLDRYEKEPLLLIGAAFLWGFVPAAIFSLITQLVLGVPFLLMDESGVLANFVGAVFLAPVTEELFKGLAVLLIFLLWKNEFDGVFDGILYGGLVGFGFAAIENILYFSSYGIDLIFLRAFVFGLNHAFFTSLIGIGFGVARHSRSGLVRFAAPLIGLAGAMFVHFLHNATVSFVADVPALCLLTLLSDYGGTLFVFVVILLAMRRERDWIRRQLPQEVAHGTLSQEQAAILGRPLQRVQHSLAALFSRGPAGWLRVTRFQQLATELAYKRHAQERRGEKGASDDLIESLRGRVRTLSAEVA